MSTLKHTDQLAETQRAFSDATSRTAKFIISSGIILLILLVVVGQELREYRAKQGALVRQIKELAKDNGGLIDDLERKCGNIDRKTRELNEPDEAAFRISRRARALRDSALEARRKDDLFADQLERAPSSFEGLPLLRRIHEVATPRTLSPVDEFDLVREKLVNGCKVKTSDEIASGQLRWMIPRSVRSAHNGRDLESLADDERILGESLNQLKTELAKMKKEESDSLEKLKDRVSGKIRDGDSEKAKEISSQRQTDVRQELVDLIVEHKQLFGRSLNRQKELVKVVNDSHELNDRKNSIPTPFGSFQIAPRLALLGLSYASLLIYFSFYGAVRKLRRLANEYNRAADGGPYLTIPAPFWSPDPADRNKRNPPVASQYVSAILLSVLFHVVWLLIIGWLVFEGVYRWNAVKALNFEYRYFWSYLLIVGFICGVLAFVWLFLPPSRKTKFLSGTAVSFEPSRRHMIRIAGIGVLGILGFGVLQVLRSSRAKTVQRLRPLDFTGASLDGPWIQNKKTKIVHYFPGEEALDDVCCGSHLPLEGNQLLAPSSDMKGVHAGCEVRIYQGLAAIYVNEMLKSRGNIERQPEPTKEARQHGELALRYLDKAIERTPFSLHLYDSARNVYAALKKYDEIKPFLEKGRHRVQTEIANLGYDPNQKRRAKKLKFLHRTDSALAARIKTTDERKQRAAQRQNKDQSIPAERVDAKNRKD